MRRVYGTYLLMAVALLAFAPANPVYLDIYQNETDTQLIFGNQRLEIKIDKATGEWQSWTIEKQKEDLLTTINGQPALDFSIGGTHMVAKHGSKLIRHEYVIDKARQGASLAVTVGVAPDKTGSFAYELTSIYKLFPLERRVERSARLLRTKADQNGGPGLLREHLDGFRFQVPGAVIGTAGQCALTVPGPFFTTTFVRPETPYDSLKTKKITFHSAPDAGFGLLILQNKTRKTALASFMNTGGEVAYRSAIEGNGQTITLRHDDKRAYYLTPGMTVESDVHHLDLGVSDAQAMQAYRKMVTATYPPDPITPSWVRDQVILELYPKYFGGGLKAITAKLPFYKNVGFTMLYMMPHWMGGYSPIDPFELDPRFGTKDELRTLIKTAHGLGLKVIFDMVIHGFNQTSLVPVQRPDMFVRNETGKLANHPTWGSITPDWANTGYQQYMVDLVLHDQREYDIDGYRVDAATYKGAGWNPNVPYPAYRDGSAAPELMSAMLTALRRKKPESVLLSEVFGPVFYKVCNFAHDNQTEAVPLLQEKLRRGEYTAADYKAHLTGVFNSLPKGANRVFYARNHDTSWFYHFDGYTPDFMAFEAIHALFGIPEIFAGDPDHKFNPDDSPQTYGLYKRLFSFRKQYPEWVRGEVMLDAVSSTNRQVFSGMRKMGNQASVALVSFSDKAETATLTISNPPAQPVSLSDVYTGQLVKMVPTGAGMFTVTLNPFQALAGRVISR